MQCVHELVCTIFLTTILRTLKNWIFFLSIYFFHSRDSFTSGFPTWDRNFFISLKLSSWYMILFPLFFTFSNVVRNMVTDLPLRVFILIGGFQLLNYKEWFIFKTTYKCLIKIYFAVRICLWLWLWLWACSHWVLWRIYYRRYFVCSWLCRLMLWWLGLCKLGFCRGWNEMCPQAVCK